MTHDELLERLDELKWDVGDSGINEESKAVYALRAVVELTPEVHNLGSELYREGWNAAMKSILQAIEKELK